MNQKRLIILSIVATGITSVSTQLITVREFMTQFHGNEITISLVLFCWLFLTGLGSFAAKFINLTSLKLYALLILIIAVWPLIQLSAIRELRDAFFIHGVSPGFYPILFFILIIITPYCLLTGFILPFAQQVLNRQKVSFKSGNLYFTDSIGDIAGGVLFSFVLVYWLKPFYMVAVTSTFLLLVSIFLFYGTRGYVMLIMAIFTTFLFYVCALSTRVEVQTLEGQYGHIVQYVESPYGRIVVSKEASQLTFWESGTPLYSGSNIITSEEKVHYPLCQLDRVQTILLVSGGLGETISEVKKYSPTHIDYVELDPALTKTALNLGVIDKSPLLEIINFDARRYIKTTKKKYDAIIIDLPDPDTFQVNRFFTSEFFFLAEKTMSQGGVFSISIDYSHNYISEIQRQKIASIYRTLKLHFKNIHIIPGENAYFICRQGPVHIDIPERLARKGINTSYIDGYFYGNVTEERINKLEDVLVSDADINTDLRPHLMNITFRHWFMKHGTSPVYFLLVMLGLTLGYWLFIRREESILFSTGLVAMGVEMLVIFSFQVVYGYIYLKIGALVTVFLLGLLPGVLAGSSVRAKGYGSLCISEILFLLLLWLFYLWTANFRSELHPAYYMLYCFLFSFVCGFQFPIITDIIGEHKSPAAGCLAADLVGASVGTLVTGTLIIPLWGIQTATIFLMLIKVSSCLIVFYLSNQGVQT